MLALQVLANLHAMMCSHGDVKPDNIMVDLSKPGCPAMLIDFALARTHHKGECSRHRGLADAQTVHVQKLKLCPLRLLRVAQPSVSASLAAQPFADLLTLTFVMMQVPASFS